MTAHNSQPVVPPGTSDERTPTGAAEAGSPQMERHYTGVMGWLNDRIGIEGLYRKFGHKAFPVVLSIKVVQAGQLREEGGPIRGDAAHQAMAGVPVTARQVAKRWSRVWR